MGTRVMAGVTFREAARKKVLWMAFIAAAGFLALFATGMHFQAKGIHVNSEAIRRQILNTSLMMGLYAGDLLTVLMTILIAADTLSGEIASGTIQAIATKPVTRRQILLGKWLGFVGMLTVYILFLLGGVALLGYTIGGATVEHLWRGLGLVWLESILLLNITLLCGTAFSTLASGVVVLGMHGVAFLGGWIEQIGAVTHSQGAVNVGIVASILMPSEALWRRAAFEMQSPLASVLNISPFGSFSVPSRIMIAYAAVYLLVALGLALRRFRLRDL
ncbi:MAG TPA: ABC transporter permease [Terriglobia bacterium]|nr:ABC transporter permease [Terriglobia bacterium]